MHRVLQVSPPVHRVVFLTSCLALASLGACSDSGVPASVEPDLHSKVPASDREALLSGASKAPSYASPRADFSRVPARDAWGPEHTALVAEACSRCHVLPPADALPANRWEETIIEMGAMPLPLSVSGLTGAELGLAITFYLHGAPVALPALPGEMLDPGPPRFRAQHFTPRGLERERIPAVSFLGFIPNDSARSFDLLACEMRSSSLLMLPGGLVDAESRLHRAFGELNFPSHATAIDLDRDGAGDLVIAALGGMNPSNAEAGTVEFIRAQSGRGPARHTLLRGVGRVASVRGADFDRDEDIDLAVAVFGWRGPGRLLVLENRTTDWQRPQFFAREIDGRDGFVALETADLDGDGGLDIVGLVAQEHEEVVAFLSRSDFVFDALVLSKAPHPGWGYAAMQAVDLDGDNDLDFLLANGDALDEPALKPYHGVAWLQNKGGLLFDYQAIGNLHGCECVRAADLDSDGDADVVGVAFLPHIAPQEHLALNLDSVVWWEQHRDAGSALRDRGPRWRRHVLEKHRAIHPALAIGDCDGDGDPDIAVGNFVWIEADGTPKQHSDYVTLFLGGK